MAKFIKGASVANATTYELYKKIVTGAGEENTTTYSNAGFISASTGAVTNTSSTWIHSDFIKLEELTGKVGIFVGHASVANAAYYSAADYGTYLGHAGSGNGAISSIQNNVMVDASAVTRVAPEGAKYVVFSTDGSKQTLTVTTVSSGVTTYNYLSTANAINFEVSALGLGVGSHVLVVKAKAEGYEDSDYSNEVVYTEEETAVVYSVTRNLTNVGAINTATSVNEGDGYSDKLAANTGYTIDEVTVTMGGVDITSTAYNGGSISISSVTGDIVITATANINTYTVTNNFTNATSSNTATTVTHGSAYSATITADSGYSTDSVTVTMGGVDITASAVNGRIVIIDSVTGALVITATATEIVAEKLATPEIYLE